MEKNKIIYVYIIYIIYYIIYIYMYIIRKQITTQV